MQKIMKKILTPKEYSNIINKMEDYFDTVKAQELEEEKEKDGINLNYLIKKYNLMKGKNE